MGAMTWRERNQQAREAGAYQPNEKWLASCVHTCAIGETARRMGVDLYALAKACGVDDTASAYLGSRFVGAIFREQPDAADALLEEIEDIAMTLKRSAS